MPIIVTRTGQPVHSPALTQQQKDRLWESIVRAYVKAHPEVLKELEEPA